LLAHLTSDQIQNIGLQEVARASEVQQRKLEELYAVGRQKLAETENALAAKVEAFDLLQAEANKLLVGKEFLDKQLASKDSRISVLEREVQELTARWRACSTRASRRLWFKHLARTQGSMSRTVTLPTTPSMGKLCLLNWAIELQTLSLRLLLFTFFLRLITS